MIKPLHARLTGHPYSDLNDYITATGNSEPAIPVSSRRITLIYEQQRLRASEILLGATDTGPALAQRRPALGRCVIPTREAVNNPNDQSRR